MVINSKQLSSLVQDISKGISANPIIPILECIKFELSEGVLTLTASDITTTIVSKVEVDSKDEIRVCIPAKIFLEIIRSIPEQPITITASEKFDVVIKSDKGKYKIAGQKPNDYLVIKCWEIEKSFEIDSDLFINAITKTAFAASNDQLKPSMTGITINGTSEKLDIIGIDGYKMAKYELHTIGDVAIIALKTPMLMLLGLTEGNLKIDMSGNNISYSFSKNNVEYKINSVNIDAPILPYESVIPNGVDIECIINKNELLSSIKRLNNFTNSLKVLLLSFNESTLSITAENKESENNATEVLECNCNGVLNIGANSSNLLEILNKVTGDEVKITLFAYNRPIVITGSDSNEYFLTMPVKTSEEK